MSDEKLKRKLIDGLLPLVNARGSDHFDAKAIAEALFQYLTLLHKWNQAYNLTAVRDINEMVTRHIFDSLAIIPWLREKKILDVGTGPGLPGIPIALVRPDLHVVLLDSNGKKIRFLQEVKRVLSLQNVDIVQTRVETYQFGDGFDTVVSRAFADLNQMINWTKHLIAKDGIWLAMKGQTPDEELALIPYHYHVQTYSVPDLEGKRCGIIIENKG